MGGVFLTGATGFVGHHILNELEARGMRTTIAVRPGWETRIEINPKLTSVVETEDLFSQSEEWWCDNLSDVDLAIHSAWVATPGSYLTSVKNIDCLAGTISMAKAAAEVKLPRFVGLGTCIEYQNSDKPLAVESPLDPKTLYSAAKVSSFLTLREMFTQSGVSFLWCRLFHPFGAGETPGRLVPYLHQQLSGGSIAELTQGTQVRDFIEITKVAKLIVDGALSKVKGAANICEGEGKTVRELAEEIADVYGRRDLLKFGARPENEYEIARIVGIPTVFSTG